MLNDAVTAYARRELAKVVRFEPGRKAELPEGDSKPRLLYLHVPFCERLCPYCSFHRVPFEAGLGHEYFRALRREMELYRELGHKFSGVYVGGGTPTVLVDELAKTLDHARELFGPLEVSVETNPDHLTEERLAVLKQAKVNRLSVGIQSFDDGLLGAMDRFDKYGSGEKLAERLKAAQGIFDTLNADMMFNFPTQDMAMLDHDLDVLLSLKLDQVTFYPLMISDTTRREVEAKLGQVDYSKEEAFYQRIVARLVPEYRFSSAWCFSRSAGHAIDEYVVEYDEYAGLGSGAIGFLMGSVYANTFDIPAYIAQVSRGESALWASRRFGKRELVRYDLIMKLFSTRLDLSVLRRKHGRLADLYIASDLAAFSLAGAIKRDGDIITLTERGRYIWVILMREFFIAVNNLRDYCRKVVPSI